MKTEVYQIIRDSRKKNGYDVKRVHRCGLPSDGWIDGQERLGLSYFMVDFTERKDVYNVRTYISLPVSLTEDCFYYYIHTIFAVNRKKRTVHCILKNITEDHKDVVAKSRPAHGDRWDPAVGAATAFVKALTHAGLMQGFNGWRGFSRALRGGDEFEEDCDKELSGIPTVGGEGILDLLGEGEKDDLQIAPLDPEGHGGNGNDGRNKGRDGADNGPENMGEKMVSDAGKNTGSGPERSD